ncbi:helicase-related protein [Mameliella sp. AT18]|uniref:helicase-related protein n=1 Tax=Mameliella TaxID=1434019 RepID=UPI0008411A51|nr:MULTISPECIES: helicase-related protein [Mameliella]MCR9273536.1 helicase-related protein [Paracoccaceae bacterium]MDD9733078.1 helicase-related protein [Mameliella sp. AT18]ODM47057.1 disulfide oxidoreductase [Ruegeria sp. PBVC088]OWV55007.1 disulfide oxidoreductase [Mameliella alba]
MAQNSRIAAVLGPTNTGKTHYAIERMLGYRTGVIGLPLRLLAREVFDKIVAIRGPSVVALVTGEERIVPPRAKYWVCTVEAMPEGMGTDFVAIDEIQLCADPERGHVFTDRLLRMRGTHETLFLGSDTMRGPIGALVPGVEYVRRERMSQLVYTGSKKISRLPARTAIVGFSVDNVYAIAELLKRQKGGAAVVMGALSPRTRNAQVDLYQNGEVDYLVATDAIGMGLNLDIDHVAFSSLTKFDGRRMRPLQPNELAQIAGRAGRGMSNGTFGVTGDTGPIPDEWAEAICNHSFTPLKKLNWRSSALRFGSIDALDASLDASPDHEMLTKAREADDLRALRALASEAEVRARASDTASVQLLWDVCRIPDFRGISPAEHAGLLGVIFGHLHQNGRVPDDFLARQVNRIDRTDGDIDTLSKRLAYIRTWTYVAQRKGWVADEDHWRGRTRAVEDALSDALHERLTQRFVDRRTSVLLRRLKQKEALLAEVNDQGEVTVEGHLVGRLEGFRFRQDKDATGQEAKTLRQASLQALTPHFHLRADRFYNAPDTEIDFTEQGGLMWGDQAVGKLAKGDDPLKPRVVAFVDDEAGHDVAEKVTRRLQHFMDRKIAALFEPLLKMRDDEALTGLARGFAFQMVEQMGVIPRSQVADDVKALDQDARGSLRKHGVRFGQYTIFMPLLLKPAPTRLRLVLWSLANGLDEFPEAPPPGLVTVPNMDEVPAQHYTLAGYRKSGARAIRIDMLERLADMLRAEDSRGGFEAKADMLSITGMTLEQFADLMQGLGYRAEKGEREKVKPADAVVAGEAGAPADDKPVMDAAGEEPAGVSPDAGETPEPADVAAPVAQLEDEGEAPVSAEPAEPVAESPVPETPEEELTPGEAPDEALAGPEMEIFYSFTWGGNRGNQRRGGGKPRRDARGGDGAKGGGRPQRGDRQDNKGGERPRGKGGKPKGKPPRDGGGRKFEARPPKKDKPIDPDNPFAAALMGLKDKT